MVCYRKNNAHVTVALIRARLKESRVRDGARR